MDNISLMNKRTSIRSFLNEDLTLDQMDKINFIVTKNRKGPFGSEHSLKIINTKDKNLAELGKMTSYGLIKGATLYFGGYCNADDQTLIDYGYCFQEVVLELTALNLGTCWLGGTFSRSFVAKALSLPTGKVIPAISPVGVPLDKLIFKDKLVRLIAKADKRKPHNQLFFKSQSDNTIVPFIITDKEPLNIILESIRFAPSASNKQPWRIVLQDKTIHLYWDFDEKYNSMSKTMNIQALDMGITLCHIIKASEDLSIIGSFNSTDPKLDNIQWRYVASWEMDS